MLGKTSKLITVVMLISLILSLLCGAFAANEEDIIPPDDAALELESLGEAEEVIENSGREMTEELAKEPVEELTDVSLLATNSDSLITLTYQTGNAELSKPVTLTVNVHYDGE